MNEYILLMHDDAPDPELANDDDGWAQYVTKLVSTGHFDGGSAIGQGAVFKQDGAHPAASLALNGYLRIRAEDMDAARKFLAGNPVFEAGGSVEIRELLRT
ncbi:hypothetical protein GTP23_09950 [Pseudoduganella sp. FT93W]|uniref:YCII-related domain-containing protein n=1 Tax=Duganella fentianensis TaxID=2692177 RepID=A0A845I0W9_9BURK|nr:YciI family protein [Duganella fentianensis]MYN45371.1 hypothetical protein [Duganella fentianensis]